MIFGKIDSRSEDLTGTAWDRAFEFLAGLDAEAKEGRYELDGDALYAIVERYETRPPGEALPEAHRTYVDIQAVLSGREQVAVWSTPDLESAKPYNPDQDIGFYHRPGTPDTVIDLVPGVFAVFFPGDAHMPCLHPESGPASVKKVVIKIRRQEA